VMGKSGHRLGVTDTFLSTHVYGHYSSPFPTTVITFRCFLCDFSFSNSGLWLHLSAVINVPSEEKQIISAKKWIQTQSGQGCRDNDIQNQIFNFHDAIQICNNILLLTIYFHLQCNIFAPFPSHKLFGRTRLSKVVSNSLKLLHSGVCPTSHITC
jgi:hypothetical protein